MDVKLVVVLSLLMIALVLIGTVAIVLVKAGVSHEASESPYVKKMLDLAKAIITALIFLVGGAAVTASLTSCVAKRSITVQGTIVKPANGDSTRVIISSQESYTGMKK